MSCEYCEKELTGQYLSRGNVERFCSRTCARGFSTKKNREQINTKVSAKRKKSDREGGGRLRRLMIKNGLAFSCEICMIDSWNQTVLSLHVDHIDGNRKNSEMTNLRFLCPNCHSQTPTWGHRNTILKRKNMLP